ncbi:hypothetical protein [Embleya sp. NPDC020630]|uniref:hypothetical protein n=1 Tax=unclassified Embleya TaxID=2699296 RepID=UPI0037A4E43B
MTVALHTGAGAAIEVRRALQADEARDVPAHTWVGPIVRVRPQGERHYEDVAYIDAAPTDGMGSSPSRHLVLWADRARRQRIAAVGTYSAASDYAVYSITGPAGEHLATVHREQGSIRRLRRTSWTIRPAEGPTLHAAKGTTFGWIAWWALSPLWGLMMAVAVLGGKAPRLPLRTIWRHDGRRVFEYLGSVGTTDSYELPPGHVDCRILLALAALHNSHPGWYDRL